MEYIHLSMSFCLQKTLSCVCRLDNLRTPLISTKSLERVEPATLEIQRMIRSLIQLVFKQISYHNCHGRLNFIHIMSLAWFIEADSLTK